MLSPLVLARVYSCFGTAPCEWALGVIEALGYAVGE